VPGVFDGGVVAGGVVLPYPPELFEQELNKPRTIIERNGIKINLKRMICKLLYVFDEKLSA
jgi:hypothetical protein